MNTKHSERSADRLRTAAEVADQLCVSLFTLYDWRTRGKGPRAIKVGKHLRYRQADVDAWLEANADPIPA